MNKNVLYLLITIAAIVLVMMFTSHSNQEPSQTTSPAASPTNGMVGSTTDQPAGTPDAAEGASEMATPGGDADGTTIDGTTDVDDVPSGAEVSGESNAPSSSTPAPDGTALPPSEGQ
jgi:hypothetical protein